MRGCQAGSPAGQGLQQIEQVWQVSRPVLNPNGRRSPLGHEVETTVESPQAAGSFLFPNKGLCDLACCWQTNTSLVVQTQGGAD